MIRLILFLVGILAAAAGLHWLADRPGSIVIEWQSYVAETSVFRAFVALLALIALVMLVWSGLRSLWASPATLGRYLHGRRQQRGLDAISSGIIAVGAGDRLLASRYASQARKALPNEPLTHLLRAQTAELTGDRATSRRIFEAMLASPDTEQLGLRGLFLEAQRENAIEASRQFAERALKLNPKLDWPVEALFDLQCRAGDWQGALDTLAIGRRQHLIERSVADRRRAVLLTAQAQALEDSTPQKALELALEAHRLAPDLVPAATIAGRQLASQGSTPRTARVLLKTWRLAPHPDLATVYAYARPGDSPRDRLNRVRHLGRLTPHSSEGPIAIAVAAIEAREWDEARTALEPLLEGRLTQRVCTLMARIESEQNGDAGRVREWLARAVNAPRDPTWTADGAVSDHWAPLSPVTGALDAFRWRVPVEAVDAPQGDVLAARVEALVPLGSSPRALEPAGTREPPEPEAQTIEVVEIPVATPTPAPAKVPAPVTPRPEAKATVDTPPPDYADPEPEPRQEPRTKTAARTAPKPVAPKRPQSGGRAVPEPTIFVSPRAPDDPGPDAAEPDRPEGDPFHPSQAKA
jgi:HemY protein